MVHFDKVRILAIIKNSVDPKDLRKIALNARQNEQLDIAAAADKRLYTLLASEAPDPFKSDVWRSIYALEGTLSNERNKTTKLTRTRQKIKNVGEEKTIGDLILTKKPSPGFLMLIERDMTEFTFESVALRHQHKFDEVVLDAAKIRLEYFNIGKNE